MTPRWPQDPEAARLLASCAATPPARRWAHTHDTLDGGKVMGWRYSRKDERVKALDQIFDRIFLEACNTDVQQAKAEYSLHVDEALAALTVSQPIGRLAREAVGIIEKQRKAA